jgi:hypothetical protein
VKRKLEKNIESCPDKTNRKFACYIKTKTKAPSTIGPLLTADKRLITEEREIVEELNKYFSSVSTLESENDVPEADEENIAMEMPRVQISREKTKEKIKELRRELAPGPVGIIPEC